MPIAVPKAILVIDPTMTIREYMRRCGWMANPQVAEKIRAIEQGWHPGGMAFTVSQCSAAMYFAGRGKNGRWEVQAVTMKS